MPKDRLSLVVFSGIFSPGFAGNWSKISRKQVARAGHAVGMTTVKYGIAIRFRAGGERLNNYLIPLRTGREKCTLYDETRLN
jgi:hypothetical protein